MGKWRSVSLKSSFKLSHCWDHQNYRIGNSGQVSSLKSHRGTEKVQEVQRGRKGTPQESGSMHFHNLCLLDLVQFHLFEIPWTFLGRSQIWHDMVKLIVYFDFSPLLKKNWAVIAIIKLYIPIYTAIIN